MMPLTDECRLAGLKDINFLLQKTLERDNKGYCRTDYVQVFGGLPRAVSTQLYEAARLDKCFVLDTYEIAKLGKIILIPGSNEYFGDSIEGMSRFVCISEGLGLDGLEVGE